MDTRIRPDTPARRRLSPDARKDEIVTAAIALFAASGFDGSTRDVARQAGITQPLLYRYFPNKESLIEAVYSKVFLQSWNSDWDAMMEDRQFSVRQRFQHFYEAYTETVFDPVWLRLWNFAALRDSQIHDWYNHVVEEQILKRLVRERRVELGHSTGFSVNRTELAAPWLMHGGLMHYGLRHSVLGLTPETARAAAIAQALDMYLATTLSP